MLSKNNGILNPLLTPIRITCNEGKQRLDSTVRPCKVEMGSCPSTPPTGREGKKSKLEADLFNFFFFYCFQRCPSAYHLLFEVQRPIWFPHRLFLPSQAPCPLHNPQPIFHCNTWKSALYTRWKPNQSQQMECVGYLRIVAEQI